ncbi:MAG: hypothetical protein ACRC7O_05140 [Fimbriiglobus sp.]
MTLTRWKMMAGVLGLSLGGLAALAESPPKPGTRTANPVCPVPVPVAPAPFTIPAPIAVEISPALVPSVPGPLQIPVADAPIMLDPVVSTPAEIAPVVAAPIEIAPTRSQPITLPLPVPTASAKPTTVEVAPYPRRVETKVVEISVPGTAIATVAAELPVPVPAPAPAPITPPTPAVIVKAEPTPVAAPAVAEKKLRVVLNMGDDRPRFEVRDGEDALLKVTCERVDVKSPSDRGEPMSTMRAVGEVVFVTPGGEGTCDELSVIPGTGQVVVTGKVKFRYNWGKLETEVSGDRMTFRLGAAPGASASAPSTAVPASFKRR